MEKNNKIEYFDKFERKVIIWKEKLYISTYPVRTKTAYEVRIWDNECDRPAKYLAHNKAELKELLADTYKGNFTEITTQLK